MSNQDSSKYKVKVEQARTIQYRYEFLLQAVDSFDCSFSWVGWLDKIKINYTIFKKIMIFFYLLTSFDVNMEIFTFSLVSFLVFIYERIFEKEKKMEETHIKFDNVC